MTHPEDEAISEAPAAGRQVHEVMRVRLPPWQTWQLVADHEAQRSWLGRGSHLRLAPGARLLLRHEAGDWRGGSVTETTHLVEEQRDEEGRILKERRDGRIACLLWPAPDWERSAGCHELEIVVSPHGKSGTQVEVRETGFSPVAGAESEYEDARAFWIGALESLRDLARQIQRRRRRPRQAVIVIHGIGEQEPGVTLKKFVEGGLQAGHASNGSESADDGDEESWLKPDLTSGLFELRRMVIKGSAERPPTEVYELYWAHLIQDTTLSQVLSWIRHLLLRKAVPQRFLVAWLAAWAASLGLGVFAVGWWFGWWAEWSRYFLGGGAVAVVAAALWRFLGKTFVIDSLGDAARYLRPQAANIEKRQAIREAGVDLLERLHERGNLDRIVIVGHSLGSVIAYDIITHFWIRCHGHHLRLPRVKNPAPGVERALEESDPREAHSLQHEAWFKVRANSQPWLITDLVTAGSPLSAAEFLMARDAEEFEQLKRDRVLPVCPPVSETRAGRRFVSYPRTYTDRLGSSDVTFSCFHHAAPFAVTRWHNLHFASRLLKGDAIGGPVAPQFGAWVRDVELPVPRGRSFFLHCHYWQPSPGASEPIEPHIAELHAALALDCRFELREQMLNHSPLLYLDRRAGH